MASTQAKLGPGGEIEKLQGEITHEVNTDAEHIATAVFGKKGSSPDMQRVPDNVLEARYRQAYQNQDRKWLIQEAQRDPEQFTSVARRIGVMLPEELGQSLPPAAPGPGPIVPPMPPPVAAPAPLAPPGPAPAVALSPGVTLGGIAQPAQPVPLTAPPVIQGF